MKNPELLLTLNSILLGIVGLLLGFAGFFLKDLHRKFSRLVERVNHLYQEMTREVTSSTIHRRQEEKEIASLKERVSRLEGKFLN